MEEEAECLVKHYDGLSLDCKSRQKQNRDIRHHTTGHNNSSNNNTAQQHCGHTPAIHEMLSHHETLFIIIALM